MPGTAPQVYDGLVAILPTGRAGMAAHENRLLSRPEELVDAEGVTMEDHHLRREAGVETLDATGVGTAPGYAGGTKSGTDPQANVLVSFPGSGTPATSGNPVLGAASLSTTLGLITPAGGYAAGDTLVLAISTRFTLSTSAGSVTSITDAAGNTYTRAQRGVMAASATTTGVRTEVWYSKLTSPLPAGNSITITQNVVQDIVAVGVAFTNLDGTHEATEVSGTNSATTTVQAIPALPTSSTPVLLLVAATGADQVGTGTFTAAAGWTEASETTTIARPDLALNYRVLTNNPVIIAAHDWYSQERIESGGTYQAATTQGSRTVTGSGSTDWATGTEPQRLFAGDTIILYDGTNQEAQVVEEVVDDDTLTTVEPWTTSFAATDYVVVRGSRLLTATTAGNIFKEREGDLDAVTLVSDLSTVGRPGKFIVCGKEDGNLQRKLIYINGYDVPQGLVDDGATMADISTPNPDWDTTATFAGGRPHAGCVHSGRVVLATPRGKDSHRLYMSSPTNHGDFGTTNGTTRRVRSEIGNAIWGLASFKGVLWVWKHPFGIFYIDDSDLDPTNWVERTMSEAIGCAPSPYAVCPMDDDVIFLSATGAFHLLSAVDTLGGVKASDLSWALGLNKWLRENLNLSRLNQTLSVWYPHKKVALFSVPSAGSTVNDLLLKWDFSGRDEGEPVKFSYSEQNIPDALTLRQDTDGVWKPIIGEGGTVKLLERDDRNKDGDAYTSRYQTPHIDFSHMDPALAFRRKLFEFVEFVMEPTSAGTLAVEVLVDGSVKQEFTIDATKRRQRKLLRVGDGYTLSLRVTNATVDEDFKVLAHLIYFKPGNIDESR
jgi:hypothetical protein